MEWLQISITLSDLIRHNNKKMYIFLAKQKKLQLSYHILPDFSIGFVFTNRFNSQPDTIRHNLHTILLTVVCGLWPKILRK